MRAARAGQAARAPVPDRPTYAHYPRYPQAESPWSTRESVTASGCGRDDPPATEVSLPSHSPGGCLAPSSDVRSAKADGRAADEAAAMRTRTGLPFSGCGGGRLRAAPIRDRCSFGRIGTGSGPTAFGPAERNRQDTGSSEPGPARQKAVPSGQRTATGSIRPRKWKLQTTLKRPRGGSARLGERHSPAPRKALPWTAL